MSLPESVPIHYGIKGCKRGYRTPCGRNTIGFPYIWVTEKHEEVTCGRCLRSSVLKVHIQDYGKADGIGQCGAEGRTMSHHELKRGRITCSKCIAVYQKEAKAS